MTNVTTLPLPSEHAARDAVTSVAESAIIQALADDGVIPGGIIAEVDRRSQPAKRGGYGRPFEGWRTTIVGEPNAAAKYPVEFACRLGVRLVANPGWRLDRQIKFRATLRSRAYAENRCSVNRDTSVVETEEIGKAAASYVRRVLPWLRTGSVYAAATPDQKAQLDSQDYGVEWKTGAIVHCPG